MGFLKDCKEAFLIGFRSGSLPENRIVPKLAEVYINNKSTVILRDQLLLRRSGYMFAGYCVEPERNVISVDDTFMQLTNNCKQFVLLHEEGHIVNEHYKQKFIKSKRLLIGIMRKIPKEEIEADKHALNFIGKENVLKAINELLSYVPDNKELKLRYNYFQNL